MALNKLADLNNHLFAQIEKLTDQEYTGDNEDLKREIQRSKALCELSSQVVGVHETVLEAAKLVYKADVDTELLPETFGVEPKKLGL